jgi:hypothetical protein
VDVQAHAGQARAPTRAARGDGGGEPVRPLRDSRVADRGVRDSEPIQAASLFGVRTPGG